ncbi:unnamed protein product [Plutella xylostella]|uniref:(diamondback moth) hypothetical protein n=1 Tax=Plutella xylostella TaxID=51655 RepID=A0A8S4G0F9_PLUXY|nr:unnamed protein product [Plutella xylostella]
MGWPRSPQSRRPLEYEGCGVETPCRQTACRSPPNPSQLGGGNCSGRPFLIGVRLHQPHVIICHWHPYCVSSTWCGMGDGQLHNAGEAWCRWCWDQEVDTKRPPAPWTRWTIVSVDTTVRNRTL